MDGWPEDEGMTLVFEPRESTKVCPRCGERVFADMCVCYGCLYDFSKANEQVLTESYEDEEEKPPKRFLRISSTVLDATIPLANEGITVGRSSECDVVLHARSVSRIHVRVVPDGEGARAQDLKARNPATVHGRPVGEGAHLDVGDVLLVCGVSFTLT